MKRNKENHVTPTANRIQANHEPAPDVRGRASYSTTPPRHHSATPQSPPSTAHYALTKHLGFWDLTFAGQHAVLKHEQGVFYVAYLLANPPEQPLHALDLAARIHALHHPHRGLAQIVDPGTGQAIHLEASARIQERSLSLDDANTMRAVLRKEEELEALLEDPDQIEPVREEVQRELIELYAYEKKNTPRTRDNAQKAVHAISMSIKRLHRRLNCALNAEGEPHLLLRSFARHIHDYLLIPSGRYAGAGRARAIIGVAGCFTYQPPNGIIWES